MYKPGDVLEVKKGKQSYKGILMPSEFADDVLMLKLENGYNVGIKLDKSVKVKKVGHESLGKFPEAKYKRDKKLPTISLITTGGTITTKVDYKTGAVHSLSKPEELLFNIPELSRVANLNIISPFTVMSEDITSKEWSKLAEVVVKELNKKDVSGVIVTHGTDALHFTSAVLSFMIKDLNKPVALIGGQRSSDRGSFDGAMNLVCAAHYCLSDIAEVSVVMHGESSDSYSLANPGTKVRKMHTSSRDAFRPINTLPLAKIYSDGKLEILKKYNKRLSGKATLSNKFESKVALIKAHPGASPDIIEHYIKNKYKGLVVEAMGLGHVPTSTLNKKDSWLPAIKKAVKSGLVVCFAPQCLYGRLDPHVYRNLRLMLDAGVIYLEDTLPETAYVKLSWALANTKDVKKTMTSNLVGEISKRIEPNTFLY
jgi:glutamyl-tRNA(Gln) amidotransferase subunit D